MQHLSKTCSGRRALASALCSMALAAAACGRADGEATDSINKLRAEAQPACSPEDGEESAGEAGESPVETPETAEPAGESSLFCAARAVIADACHDCHGEELAGGAPMPLVTFEDFVADAPITDDKPVYEVIAERIHDGERPMPPQRKLTADELAAIDAWIEAGAEPGDDPTCADQEAEAPEVVEREWPPEGSEDCYELKVPNTTVEAGTEPHPQFFFDAPWGDEEVQALGFRPITDNKKILHHWILYSGTGVGGFLSGWAPGQDDSVHRELPPDVGIAMPSGPRAMRLDMHYYNLQGTSAEQDASGVEVCITRKLRPNPAGTYMGFVGIPILLPGEKTDIVGTCNVTVEKPVYILSESPHAHELAHWMKFEVIRDGETIVLRDEAFNFEEQTSRPLPEPFELKTGDQVLTTCSFENTSSQVVTFGENTGDEMCFNFATIYPLGSLSCNPF